MMSSTSSSHPKPNNRHHIANRRSEVWSYLCQGMTRQDIAIALKVDASTVSRDIEYLTLKSQQYIDDMAKKTLPFMYQKSIEGINEVLKECWHIYNQKDTVPPLVRLMRNNNKNNDNHILTPAERVFCQRMAMEGTQKIIDVGVF
jgi:DNA-binding CsgD family transcriptional regulator